MTTCTNARHAPRLGRLALAGLLALAGAHASAVGVSSRAALNGSDTIDWAQLGVDFTQVTEPGSVISTGAVAALVSSTGGELWRMDQGSFTGNFAAGDALLWTNFAAGPIVVDFNVGLSKVGAQITANDYGSFTGVVSVFSVGNTLLESHSFGGVSSSGQDNSAIFVGASRSSADIDRVEFSITGSAGPDFAINRLDFTVGAVPEPTTWILWLAGLAAVGGAARRRQK